MGRRQEPLREATHLPERLQAVSKPVGDLANDMANRLPASAETSAGLRKLLEAEDCFVRAALTPTEGDISHG